MHIVTNEGTRNIRFYERNNFRILSMTCWNNARVVFMGRKLEQNGSAILPKGRPFAGARSHIAQK